MPIHYHKRFLKDLADIPAKQRATIEKLVFQKFQTEEHVVQSGKLEKLKGYNIYYKIKVGNYRIGVKIDDHVLSFERILHRKEIYKFYP